MNTDLFEVGITDPLLTNLIIEYSVDFNVARAARTLSLPVGKAKEMLEDELAKEAIGKILARRRDISDVDHQWVLEQLVTNHHLARQEGNIAASNTALHHLMRHRTIDAMASEKLDVNVGTVQERLARARERIQKGVTIEHQDSAGD